MFQECFRFIGRYLAYRSTDMAFWADADISAMHEPITDISKIFKSWFLLQYQKYNVFDALRFFKNFENHYLWAKIFQIAAISIFCYDF